MFDLFTKCENLERPIITTMDEILSPNRPAIKLKPCFLVLKGRFFSIVAGIWLAIPLPGKAAIIGQMPSLSEVLYITSEPCIAESGRVEPNWYFSYWVNAVGTVTRSCYVRYNDQIWIKGPYGSESTFPMSYFSKPSTAPISDESSEIKQ
jgi:hypothetical protein